MSIDCLLDRFFNIFSEYAIEGCSAVELLEITRVDNLLDGDYHE